MSFEELTRRHYPAMLRIAMAYVRDREVVHSFLAGDKMQGKVLREGREVCRRGRVGHVRLRPAVAR
jgi:hypothetical protein